MSVRRVLLLGGTGDALRTARALAPHDVYSLAGLGRVPDDLACGVRVGGFGGADGLAPALKSRAELLLRVSSLTLPHGMVRVLLAEQLYRAWSITQNHPYHRA